MSKKLNRETLLKIFVLTMFIITSLFNTISVGAMTSNFNQNLVYDDGGGQVSTTPKKITISRTSMTMYVGDVKYLSAIVVPATANATVRWLSTNTSVAYVSGGAVQAKAPGTATITAKISDSLKAQCTVTVLAKPKCSASNILDGHSQYLGTSYINKKASTHDEVTTCSSCGVSWTKASVPHTYTNNLCVCGYKQQATGISLSQENVTITVGQTLSITATITPSGSEGSIQWLSTNPDIVYARKNGEKGAVLEAKSIGTAKVTAKISDSIKAQCDVTVVAKPTCTATKYLEGHSQKFNISYINKNANTHDEVTTCQSCNTFWTTSKIPHKYVNNECECGYKQQATGISLNKKHATLTVGETLSLTATVTPSGAEATIQWVSSKPEIAMVNKTTTFGSLVTAKEAGTAVITVKISDKIYDVCEITVIEKEVVKEENTEVIIPEETEPDKEETKPKITCGPNEIINGHTIIYTYNNIKTETHDMVTKCSICNVSWATKEIKHLYIKGECVCKNKQPVTGITLDKTTATINVGDTLKLVATILPKGASGSIEWSSSDSKKATVINGTVKGIEAGKVIITAKISNKVSAICNITVIEKEVCNESKILSGHKSYIDYKYSNIKSTTHDITTMCLICEKSWTDSKIKHIYIDGKCKCGNKLQATNVIISETSVHLKEKEQVLLTAQIIPTDAKDVIQWFTSNKNVATVSQNGLVTAIKAGTAKIFAEASNGVNASCMVTVSELPKCSLGNILTGHNSKIVTQYENIKNDTHDVKYECTECGTSWEKTKVEHIFKNEKCECGQKEEHKYIYTKKDDKTHIITCVTCDFKEETEHSEKDLCECGFKKEEKICEHPEFVWETIKEASCSNSGEDVEKCVECGFVRSTKATGREHNYKPMQIKGDVEYHIGVCEECGEEGKKEKHLFVLNNCIICKYTKPLEKCQQGKLILSHGFTVSKYKQLNAEKHITVLKCKICKDTFEVENKHIYLLGKCPCGYEKPREEENVEESVPYKIYSNGHGNEEEKVKDNGGIVTDTNQKLNVEETKNAIKENDNTEFTAFSSGVQNLGEFVTAYKQASEETEETLNATIRLIEPAYMYEGGNKDSVDGVVKLIDGVSNNKDNLKIQLVIGEPGGSGREATYKATIELYVQLKNQGYDVEMYAVNQSVVYSKDGTKVDCISIEKASNTLSEHEGAQAVANEYWKEK